ncbi:47 kDa outer membrane protein precursor [Halomonas sp. THAF5a]|uniref:OmpP1/FadL family transporter n=1 Tax=Halomonas sp. THAF5a TaxID=2587844 RepID=UPI0012A7D0F4|nr:outer membrane protein transport protein [Halomonas sp. THAF5a]QFU00371.1 47 kDa outer membrane protein precursor [Halomonas sp. THAF5a]
MPRHMPHHVNRLTLAIAFASTALIASQAAATGFQVREQSAKSLANAFSNAAAGAEDVSFMAHNPAAIGNIDGNQVAGGVAYIDASFELQGAEATGLGGSNYDRGGSRQGGETATVPSFAAKTQLDERWDLGLAIYAPYGLSTKYDKDWIGRYHAVETELTTIDFQPTLNYRASERLNLAVGLRAQYADATLSNALDLASFGAKAAMERGDMATAQALGAQAGFADGFAEVTGDDWGYGYTLGVLYQATDRTRLGASYRSEIDLTLDGEVNYSSDNVTGQQVLAGAQAQGRLRDGGGTADLTTPANLNLGVYHQLTDRLALMANAEWTEWSSFDELVVEFEDGSAPSRTEENWDDTWAFSVGANYALNPQWLLRAGLGIDETPVPSAEFRTPRVPDADRRWASLGATYQPTENLGITAGYLRIFGDDVEMDQDATPTNENASRGNLSGTYEVEADVFALSVDYRF